MYLVQAGGDKAKEVPLVLFYRGYRIRLRGAQLIFPLHCRRTKPGAW